MYDCIRSKGPAAALYFISLILFGNVIMLNLFLAILLGNFEQARTFWMKKRVFEQFKRTLSQGFSLQRSMYRVLGETTKIIKENVLHKRVFTEEREAMLKAEEEQAAGATEFQFPPDLEENTRRRGASDHRRKP